MFLNEPVRFNAVGGEDDFVFIAEDLSENLTIDLFIFSNQHQPFSIG